MSNYLNKQFENSREGFISWCKTFKHLFNSDIVKTGYYKSDNYYMELNKVIGILERGHYYLGATFRQYNEQDKDFSLIPTDKQDEVKLLFWNKAKKFCDGNGLMLEFYREFNIDEEEG